MTGYQSKKAAALDEEGMYLVHHTKRKDDDDDDIQVYQRPWVGLTDDAIYAAAEIAWRAGWAACRDAEYVGEEAEDEAWGYQGATVAQDIEQAFKEKNT